MGNNRISIILAPIIATIISTIVVITALTLVENKTVIIACILASAASIIIFQYVIYRRYKDDMQSFTGLSQKSNMEEISLYDFKTKELFDIAVSINTFLDNLMQGQDELKKTNDTLSLTVSDKLSKLNLLNNKLKEEVHKHKLTESKLQKALGKAELANKVHSEFLANIRHEIRTPINAIVGLTDLMLDTDPKEQQIELLSNIKHSGELIHQVINKILDLAEIDSGRVSIIDDMFVLEEAIDMSINKFKRSAKEKNIKIIANIDSNVPELLIGDCNKLSKTFNILLENAVKFTTTGKIIISANLHHEIADDLYILFSIEDTGIGIDENMKDKIFLPFSQVDGSYTRQFDGIGLGLAIATKLIGLMGGKIDLDSSYTNGAKFNFLIKFRQLPSKTRYK